MRLSCSLFLLGLLGQSAIANPIPMYEESVQRSDRDPFKSYTSSRANRGGAKKDQVKRRGNDDLTSRYSTPYLSQDMLVRRDGWSGEDDVLEGYERDLRPDLDFEKPPPSDSSSSLEKRVDYWHVRPSQRTRQARGGLILLALTGLGGLTTWGVLRTKQREADRKRKKEEEAAAAAEAAKAKGHAPAPAPSPAGAPAPAPAHGSKP